MDVGIPPLPDSVNLTSFPAKLWRLVNNPAIEAIFWDHTGKVIVIDQLLFQTQILSPCFTGPDAFRTALFKSFARQLNLYGFRKLGPTNNAGDSMAISTYQYFYSPNFKRDHPELVANLIRLTAETRAKIRAGLEVNNQPSSGCDVSSNRSPVRPAALSPRGTPVSMMHHQSDVASSSTAMDIQQGLPFNSQTAQDQPSLYCIFLQSCHSELVAPHMGDSGLQTGLFDPQYEQESSAVEAYQQILDQISRDMELQEENKTEMLYTNI